jgi:hypothetical protein
MTDTFIQLPTDGTGKKHRSWENTVGSDDVHATAGVITAPDGTVLSDTNGVEVNGNVASGDADSGNPVKIGGFVADIGGMTPGSVGDRMDVTVDTTGALRAYVAEDQGGGEVALLAADFATGALRVAQKAVYVEDDPHASTDVGQFVLAVRNDTPSALTSTNGDYSPIAVDQFGRILTAPLPASTNNIGDVDVASLPNAATATLSNVATSTSSAQLLALNTSRKGAVIYNDSLAALYVKFGTSATSSSFTYYLAAGATLELPTSPGLYTGRIDGILASSTGTARVTELT